MTKKSYEDYLRAMYEIYEQLQNKQTGIKKSDIAEVLNISKSSVTQMMNKLLMDGMIKMDLYSKIFFTKKGLDLAKKTARKHRIIEVFLRDCLKIKSLEKINLEAHKLEHSFSDDVIDRLDKFLGKPKKCPHGDEINN